MSGILQCRLSALERVPAGRGLVIRAYVPKLGSCGRFDC